MRKLLAASLLSAMSVGPATAQLCPLEEAIQRLEQSTLQLKTDLALKQMPIVREMDALASHAKDPNLPVEKQLSPDEAKRFQQLRSDLFKLQMTYTTHSDYLRDAQAIAKTADVAHQLRNGRVLDKTSPDQFYGQVAFLALVSTGQGDIGDLASVDESECSVDAGLTALERLELKSANTQARVSAVRELNVIAQRYGLKQDNPNWIERIPNVEEKKRVRQLAAAFKDMEAITTYIRMIEALRAINRTAIMMSDVNQDDVNQSTTQEELSKRFGQRWDALVKTSTDKKLMTYDRILAMIGQTLPADTMVENQPLESSAKPLR